MFKIWPLAAVVFFTGLASGQNAAKFSNPAFRSQDPWVVLSNGVYYYSESDGDRIFLRVSRTLTGLKKARPQIVWTAPRKGLNGQANVWAPEIHELDGKWYMYFAADYAGNGRHSLYVLEGGTDPTGPYAPGDTGLAEGRIFELSGRWAIDPNVFLGHDGKLYVGFSCTEDEIGSLPQALCLARMSDPLHLAGPAVRISTPTEEWETRTGPVQEGPVGFVRNQTTFLTYSASASWTTNDYTAGILVNSGGDLLDPTAWVKHGPILDSHGKTYGPGSLVFIPSPDGTELWSLYHAYDRLDCPQWGCRSVRLQRVYWPTPDVPWLGCPVDPDVELVMPSGDLGSATGWDDSRRAKSGGGAWRFNSSSSVESIFQDGGSTVMQAFRGDVSSLAWRVSAEVTRQDGQAAGQPSEYGVYGLYLDEENYVEAFVSPELGLVGSRAEIGGVNQGEHSLSLPADFDSRLPHTIRVENSAARQFSFYLDDQVVDRRTLPLDSGRAGVFTTNTGARFEKVSVTDNSAGWGNASGDVAQGLMKGAWSLGDGYARGLWDIKDSQTVSSLDMGGGWHTLYNGNPNLGSYRVEVEARWDQSDGKTARPAYGLIVCHDDRHNQVSLWVNPADRSASIVAVVGGEVSISDLLLSPDFDPSKPHKLSASKAGSEFTFYVDGDWVSQSTIEVTNGTAGVATSGTVAKFRHFRISEH